ncbi:MAG: hypothetical protein AAGH78_00045 [Cyanobacteria bacterium P01_H01_bin.58]
MTDRNSTVEHQLRPDELMAELDIKKQAYYTYLKHLGIKARKDSKGKVYLTQVQANLMRELRAHVVDGGKIEDFEVSNSDPAALVKAETGEMDAAAQMPEADPAQDIDMNELVRGAAELAGHRMTVAHQLMLQMADQMTYEDLPDEVRVKVDSVRAATNPKHQNLSSMATDLLSQWRQKRQELQTA